MPSPNRSPNANSRKRALFAKIIREYTPALNMMLKMHGASNARRATTRAKFYGWALEYAYSNRANKQPILKSFLSVFRN